MASIKCPGCGYNYDSEKASCPICGYETKNTNHHNGGDAYAVFNNVGKTYDSIEDNILKDTYRFYNKMWNLFIGVAIACFGLSFIFILRARYVYATYYGSPTFATLFACTFLICGFLSIIIAVRSYMQYNNIHILYSIKKDINNISNS